MRLGKQPPRHDPRTLMLARYLSAEALPALPPAVDWTPKVPSWGMMGNDHIGDCLLPGTVVAASGLQRVYRIPYAGPIVSLVTVSGKRLAVTANHAVLTTRGFVRACDLRKGEYVLNSNFPEAVASRIGDNLQHAPTRIEEMAKTFGASAVFRPARMVSPVQFHGDERFFKGQIDVVDANGLLQDRRATPLKQPHGKHRFITRSSSVLALHGQGPGHPRMERVLRPAPRLMGGGGIGPPLLRSPAVGTQLGGLSSPAQFHASVLQPALNGLPTDAHLPSQLIGRCPGLIEPDKILAVDSRIWCGHVYDASTNVRWYNANGIITHNCTCAAAGHLVMLWTTAVGSEVVPPDDAIIGAYAAITGYDPKTGANDQGAVELDVLNYWRKSGIANRTITAFAALDPTNHQHIQAAIALFGGAYIGVALPKSAQGAAVWDVPAGGPVGDGAPGSWGGHAVPLVAYDQSGPTCVTWGSLKKMTWAFADAYMDEAYAVLSPDFLGATQTAASGVDLPALQADLQAITAASP